MYAFSGRVNAQENEQERSKLPFGYYLEPDADVLTLRRSDGVFVATFNAVGVDFFEVEVAVWEDAE
jgi:hypothetical protein